MENYFRKLVAFLTTFAVVTLIRRLAEKGLSHFDPTSFHYAVIKNLSVTVI